ncbi:hypothetical protein LY76DRAFT_650894 [Colletotrichum caudatum]|nr:hypothetical protein LY76DRAFT_650894 [Colletotrichum caudatum]
MCDCGKCAAKSEPVAEFSPDQGLREAISRLRRCQKNAKKKRAAFDAWGRDSENIREKLAREESLILTCRSMIDAAHDRCFTAHEEHYDRWGHGVIANVHAEYVDRIESLSDARLELQQAHARFGRVHLESKLNPGLRERFANTVGSIPIPKREIGGGESSAAAATAVTGSAGDDVSTLPPSESDGKSVMDGSEGPSEVSPSAPRRKRRAAKWTSWSGRRDHQTAAGGAPMKQGAPTKRNRKPRGPGSRYRPYRR